MMYSKNKLFFRLNAGVVYGLGHLSRCISLVEYFVEPCFNIEFLIKTDNISLVNEFIHNQSHPVLKKCIFSYFDQNWSLHQELDLICSINNKDSFLLLDHYDINDYYQHQLLKSGIHWFQFDSHAKIKFYGDLVMHASPGATEQMYSRLIGKPNTRFLLGPKYAIVNRNFLTIRAEVRPRRRLENLLMCFGGGNEKGATLKCLQLLLNNGINEEVNINVVVGNKNRDIDQLSLLAGNHKNVCLHVNAANMFFLMNQNDLGIIAPGTLSYEAATVGLPMILFNTADNQEINLRGWQEIGCACSLGSIESIQSTAFQSTILLLLDNPNLIQNMSEKCLMHVDGMGACRVSNEIKLLL